MKTQAEFWTEGRVGGNILLEVALLFPWSMFVIARSFNTLCSGVLSCPFLSSLNGSVLVLLPVLGNVVGKGIIGIWRGEQCLD